MFNRCITIRWSITSQLDRGEELSQKTLDHCAQCESCSSFLQHNKLLQVSLNRKMEVEPNARRSQQIIEAVHRSHSAEQPPQTSKANLLSNQWLLRAACCAVVCLLPIILLLFNQPQSNSPQAEIVNLQEDILSLTTLMQSASEPLKVLSTQ